MNGLNVKYIQLNDPHCYQSMAERFGIKDKKAALDTVRNWLRFAEFICEVVDEERGNPALLYAYQGVNFYLSPNKTMVYTVINNKSNIYNPLRKELIHMHKRRLNHFQIKEKACKKKIELKTLEANVEISNLKLRMHKTRSITVRNECEKRIKEINESLNLVKKELDSYVSEKRKVAKSLASII